MRVPRLVAVVLWLTVATLAVAGFAAFSPQQAPKLITTTTTTLAVRGAATGQVLARALAAGMRSTSTEEIPSQDSRENDLLNSLRAQRYVTPPPPLPTTTTPATATPPQARAPSAKTKEYMSSEEVRSIIALFFKPQDVDTALAIAKCESTLDPNAVNDSTKASGLFQQLPRYWAERAVAAGWGRADIFDPYANTAVAAWLKYYAGGWSHWTCYKGDK
ncbi:transglycosylase SLT domain protein [bacterium BMS3Abin02]|nr:transglycosylase SLT domain protein [bacterium BMS3Abin02]GBE23488.1 transglycosylase SLT domain protein [bacterium BMS3Bbin01]HDL49456.1 lytic transglycosylase domain-containing protein [Actinomycetota bacterium]